MKSAGFSMPADWMASLVNTFTVIGTSLKDSLRRRAVTSTSSSCSESAGAAVCACAGNEPSAAATAAPMSPSDDNFFESCM